MLPHLYLTVDVSTKFKVFRRVRSSYYIEIARTSFYNALDSAKKLIVMLYCKLVDSLIVKFE